MKKIIKKILKENFDDLEWADDISSAQDGWSIIKGILNQPDFNREMGKSYATELNDMYYIKLKLKDVDYLNNAFQSCGVDYPVSKIENYNYELKDMAQFERGFVDCGWSRNGSIVDAVLLDNYSVFGYDEEFSGWFLPDWADLILIPKNN